MDLLGYSINENFKKCGEITTALKLGKKTYTLNCGFCSKVFIKLHAFTIHIGETHEQEIFGCLGGGIWEELPVDKRKEDIVIEVEGENDIALTTVEVKLAEMIKDEETLIDFQDPLEQTSQNQISEGILINLEIKDKMMVHEGNFNDDKDEYINNNEVEDVIDSSDTSINSESDDDQDDETQINFKELTLATIKCYKKHRVLWDSNNSNHKQHKEAYTSIAKSVNKKLNMSLKWTNIRDRIDKLRHKFHSELQNVKLAKSKRGDYTPIWYYDKLSFLNMNKNSKLRNKKSEEVLENELPYLTDAQNLEVIEIYKSSPCLWNVQHIGFRFKNPRQKAINDMMQEIKTKMNLKLTQDELQKITHGFRDAYSQEKYRKQKCERLNKIFTPLYKFYEQISFLESNVRPFKCDFCEETFNGLDQYKMHKSTHDGSKPFICSVCNHGFMRPSNYTVHVRRHTRDYPFECKVCKKRYATSTDINVHMRHHTGEKPYFCEICGQSFRAWWSFDNHMRRHQKRPKHKCTICPKTFYEKSKFTVHMKAHLNVRDKVCNVCGKAFTSSKYLRQHKQIHTDKRYDCKICGKDFSQYTGLSGHMRSHGTTVSGAAAALIN